MKIDSIVLSRAMKLLMPTVKANPIYPVFGSIRFTVNHSGDQMLMVASNSQTRHELIIPVESASLSCCIEAAPLTKLLASIDEQMITIEQDEGSVTVHTTHGKARMPIYPVIDFPMPPINMGEGVMEVQVPEDEMKPLIDVLKRAEGFMVPSEFNTPHSGLWLSDDQNNTGMFVHGTSHVLVYRELVADIFVTTPVFIPHYIIPHLIKVLMTHEGGCVNIRIGHWLTVQAGSSTLLAVMPVEQNHDPMIPWDRVKAGIVYDVSARLTTEDMAGFTKRAASMPVAGDELKADVVWEPDNTLSIGTGDYGLVEDMPGTVTGAITSSVSLPLRNLTKAIACMGETFTLKANAEQPFQPMTMVSEDESRQVIIMPVKQI